MSRKYTFQLPNQWQWVRFENVCEAIRGITFERSEASDEEFEGSLACLTTSAVQEEVEWNTLRYIPSTRMRNSRQQLIAGDILVSTANSKPLVGKSAFVENVPFPCTFGAFVTALRPNDLCDPFFLAIWLRTPTALQFFFDYSSNTTNISNLRITDLLTFQIPLPLLSEQRRIAAILREADALRRLRRQADARARDLLPALFQEMFGDIGKPSDRWKIVTVGEAGDVQLGRQRAPQYQTGKYTRPYVRVANVFEDRIDITDLLSMDFDPADFRRYRLKYGDILLNEGQSHDLVGRPAMWRNEVDDCCFQNTLIRFRANPDKTIPEFALAVFLAYFRAGRFAAVGSQTSNVAHLGATRFAQMPFPLPPLTLQGIFAERIAEVRSAENEQFAGRQRLEDLFQSLLTRAFNGELTAVWRERHAELLHDEAVQRDIALGLRAAEPTLGDLEDDRVTRAEREEAARQLQLAYELLLQSSSPFLRSLADEMFGNPQETLIDSALAIATQPIDWDNFQIGVPEEIRIQIAQVADSFRALQQQARVQPALRQSPELAAQMMSAVGQIIQIYQRAQAIAGSRAVRDTFDRYAAALIDKLAQAPVYFRAEDLAQNGVGISEADEGLRLLAALGYVRPVLVRGRLRYRRVDPLGERVVVEEFAE